MTYQQNTLDAKNWISRPLNRKGDLNSWIKKMAQACPNPKLYKVVWINNDKNSVGYKVIGFNKNGDVIWQRGQVIWHEAP